MTAYGSPAGPPPGSAGPGFPVLASAGSQRAAMLHFAAGALGVLSFIWGFLTWFTEGSGNGGFHFAGYAFSSAGVAPIGLSILAGAIALAYTVDGKLTSFVPSAIGIAALLTVIGVAGGKGSVGPGDAQIGMGVGLILELITCVGQTVALLLAWLTANGRIGVAQPAPHPGYPAQGVGHPAPGHTAQNFGPSSYSQPHAQPGYAQQPYAQPGYRQQPPPAQPPGQPQDQFENQSPHGPQDPYGSTQQ